MLWSSATTAVVLGVPVGRFLLGRRIPTFLPPISPARSASLRASSRLLGIASVVATVGCLAAVVWGADPRPEVAAALLAVDARLLLVWGRLRQTRQALLPHDQS